MNRQPLPDLTAFLACWAVLVVAGLASMAVGVHTVVVLAGWLAS